MRKGIMMSKDIHNDCTFYTFIEHRSNDFDDVYTYGNNAKFLMNKEHGYEKAKNI